MVKDSDVPSLLEVFLCSDERADKEANGGSAAAAGGGGWRPGDYAAVFTTEAAAASLCRTMQRRALSDPAAAFFKVDRWPVLVPASGVGGSGGGFGGNGALKPRTLDSWDTAPPGEREEEPLDPNDKWANVFNKPSRRSGSGSNEEDAGKADSSSVSSEMPPGLALPPGLGSGGGDVLTNLDELLDGEEWSDDEQAKEKEAGEAGEKEGEGEGEGEGASASASTEAEPTEQNAYSASPCGVWTE